MPDTTAYRIFNFSAGPCTLPLPVLEQVAADIPDYHGEGMAIFEMSHRSKTVIDLFEETGALVREVLSVPQDMHVQFMGGGATLQFGMIPMNLLHPGDDGARKAADYTHSGLWAGKAVDDARAIGKIHLAFDGTDSNFTTLPDPASIRASDDAVYFHLTSNETVGGVQWKDFPTIDKPIVADMSSDIFTRPLDYEKFGIIYAGAQKNIGPAGCALVLLKQEIVELAEATTRGNLVSYLDYPGHVAGKSMPNTPPVFQVYLIKLVMQWLKAEGGVAWAGDMAARRSQLVYDAIANAGGGGFYTCPVDARYRSPINVVFTTPDAGLDARFVEEALVQGLSGLKGHRSLGGCRASLYNAMPLEGAQALADFMGDFAAKNG